ncbi:hypothetical protein [Duganella sp. LjRoot269]|uniref:hypothetical protein n=1 Tax=Duganella sp. LjRoot269 TaxID=3342305 RepID=UPI003ECD65C3
MEKKLAPVKAFEQRGQALIGTAVALAAESSEIIVVTPSKGDATDVAQQLGCRMPDESRMRNVAILGAEKFAEIESVIACADRVFKKFGAESDWAEWRDLGDALRDLKASGKPADS